MFISTYGHIPVKYDDKNRNLLLHKAVDFDKNIEVFELGSSMNVDEPSRLVYCLKFSSTYIPFWIESIKIVSYIPMNQFNIRKWNYVNPTSSIPQVDISIYKIGTDLTSIKFIRGTIHYHNVWEESSFHGYSFASQSEKNQVFKYIQEALPVLFFDNYGSVSNPNPSICRNIAPYKNEIIEDIEQTGTIESSCLIFQAKSSEPESPDSVLERLKSLSDAEPLSIETIMRELLEAERMNLFYGNFFVCTIMQKKLFFEIIKRSYIEYYQNDYQTYENFLIFIITIMNNRLNSRLVYKRFSTFINRERWGEI